MQRNTTDRVKPTFQAVDGLFRIGLEISLVTSAAVLPPVTSLSLINESCIISYLYWGLNGFSITDFGEVSNRTLNVQFFQHAKAAFIFVQLANFTFRILQITKYDRI